MLTKLAELINTAALYMFVAQSMKFINCLELKSFHIIIPVRPQVRWQHALILRQSSGGGSPDSCYGGVDRSGRTSLYQLHLQIFLSLCQSQLFLSPLCQVTLFHSTNFCKPTYFHFTLETAPRLSKPNHFKRYRTSRAHRYDLCIHIIKLVLKWSCITCTQFSMEIRLEWFLRRNKHKSS